jgi:hypothetical protein
MEDWSEGQKLCRARRRHHWKRFTVTVHGVDPNRLGTRMNIVQRCPDCLNRRHADFVRTARGVRQMDDWKPDYREVDGVPYLLPKGAQPVTDELREELIAGEYFTPDGTLKGKVNYVDDED